MISIYLILVLFLVALHIFTRYSRKGRLLHNIPGLLALPITGNLHQFAISSSHELWMLIRKMSNEYYPITRFYTFGFSIVSIQHPDDLEVLLTSQKVIQKGNIYGYLQPWLKTGLLTSTGDQWRERRKLLTPAFHFNILKEYLSTFNDEGLKCVDILKNIGKESVQDLMQFSSDATLSIMIESAMGTSLNNVDNELATNYKRAIKEFEYIIGYRACRPYIFDWVMKLPWSLGNLQRKCVNILHSFTARLIKKKMLNESSKRGYTRETVHLKNNGTKKGLTFLNLLLEAKQNHLIDDEGIQEEVDTFTFEGHDTTAMALTFILLLLSENKDAQEQVRAEVKEVIMSCNGKLNMSNIQDLNYLDRCIKESLRLYPPVASIMRYTEDELQLKNGLVPKNTDILVNVFDTHRNPHFWPEPNKFDPDRFLPENSIGRHPFAYVPFSAGPRNCIGQKFAMMEMKILLAHILSNFCLEPVEDFINGCTDIPLHGNLVIRPNEKIFIRFIKL